jgi:hypothetical protein
LTANDDSEAGEQIRYAQRALGPVVPSGERTSPDSDPVCLSATPGRAGSRGGQVGMDGQQHAYHLQQASQVAGIVWGRYIGRGHELVLCSVQVSSRAGSVLPDFF